MLFFLSNIIKRINSFFQEVFFQESLRFIVRITSIVISFITIFKFQTSQYVNIYVIGIGDYTITISLGVVLLVISVLGGLAVSVLASKNYSLISLMVLMLQGSLGFFFKSLSFKYKHFIMFNSITNVMQDTMLRTHWFSVHKVFTEIELTGALNSYCEANPVFNTNMLSNDKLIDQYYYFFGVIKNFDNGNLLLALNNVNLINPIIPEESNNLYYYMMLAAVCLVIGAVGLGSWYFYPIGVSKMIPVVVVPVTAQVVSPLSPEDILFITKVTNNRLFDTTFGVPVLSNVMSANRFLLNECAKLNDPSLTPDARLELQNNLVVFYDTYLKHGWFFV